MNYYLTRFLVAIYMVLGQAAYGLSAADQVKGASFQIGNCMAIAKNYSGRYNDDDARVSLRIFGGGGPPLFVMDMRSFGPRAVNRPRNNQDPGVSIRNRSEFGVLGVLYDCDLMEYRQSATLDFKYPTGQYSVSEPFGFILTLGSAIYEVTVGDVSWSDDDPHFLTSSPDVGIVEGAFEADAGADQTVASAASVTLDGSASSAVDSNLLTFEWLQISGTDVTLSDATAQQPTFTAPRLSVGDADSVLEFALVVNEGVERSSIDFVTITVEAPPTISASEFADHEPEISNMLVGDASRSLRSSVSANQRMTQDARGRFISARQTKAREEAVTQALIPFDVEGYFTLSESGLSTAGNFFQQVGNEEGTYRRLFFGDFDVQHDADTDSTTATLTGRMAWEQMTSEQTMLGYFIGGELATSNIGGSFEGDQDRIGVTAGGYVVHELSEQVYFDGFASVGAGRNNLEMANDTLALESEYTTQTATLGGAITGVYSQKGYDFKPELAFSYGKTWLGDIGFTGRAYGLVDNTLSLDAGYVSIASFTFRPEVIVPIGADFVADTNTQLSFAPRLICEQIKSTTKTSDCGTGGELGFRSTSKDGLSSADMRVLLDRINGSTRSSFAFTVEHKF